MYYRFENLEAWQLGKKFTSEIYKTTEKFPKNELFGLTNQLRRAAVSVVLNIAEGSERKSDPEFRRFLRISIGSLSEVVTGLYVALDLGFVNKKEFDKLYQDSGLVVSKIKALISKMK
ncbi:MAG: four helix bundle protein [Candidatus Yanofskybacteria bacterium]|nr:four helix bundle protein [Candidatus Yanofskybacteria bacterium]